MSFGPCFFCLTFPPYTILHVSAIARNQMFSRANLAAFFWPRARRRRLRIFLSCSPLPCSRPRRADRRHLRTSIFVGMNLLELPTHDDPDDRLVRLPAPPQKEGDIIKALKEHDDEQRRVWMASQTLWFLTAAHEANYTAYALLTEEEAVAAKGKLTRILIGAERTTRAYGGVNDLHSQGLATCNDLHAHILKVAQQSGDHATINNRVRLAGEALLLYNAKVLLFGCSPILLAAILIYQAVEARHAIAVSNDLEAEHVRARYSFDALNAYFSLCRSHEPTLVIGDARVNPKPYPVHLPKLVPCCRMRDSKACEQTSTEIEFLNRAGAVSYLLWVFANTPQLDIDFWDPKPSIKFLKVMPSPASRRRGMVFDRHEDKLDRRKQHDLPVMQKRRALYASSPLASSPSKLGRPTIEHVQAMQNPVPKSAKEIPSLAMALASQSPLAISDARKRQIDAIKAKRAEEELEDKRERRNKRASKDKTDHEESEEDEDVADEKRRDVLLVDMIETTRAELLRAMLGPASRATTPTGVDTRIVTSSPTPKSIATPAAELSKRSPEN